jgi:hypothetical protein
MPAYITFGKDWIEENSKYMDKNIEKKMEKDIKYSNTLNSPEAIRLNCNIQKAKL